MGNANTDGIDDAELSTLATRWAIDLSDAETWLTDGNKWAAIKGAPADVTRLIGEVERLRRDLDSERRRLDLVRAARDAQADLAKRMRAENDELKARLA